MGLRLKIVLMSNSTLLNVHYFQKIIHSKVIILICNV